MSNRAVLGGRGSARIPASRRLLRNTCLHTPSKRRAAYDCERARKGDRWQARVVNVIDHEMRPRVFRISVDRHRLSPRFSSRRYAMAASCRRFTQPDTVSSTKSNEVAVMGVQNSPVLRRPSMAYQQARIAHVSGRSCFGTGRESQADLLAAQRAPSHDEIVFVEPTPALGNLGKRSPSS